MNLCARSLPGAPGLPFRRTKARTDSTSDAFTLLEMCLVLFIIVLMLGVMLPSMQSAFVEQAIRKDAQQLSVMVKTGMQQSTELHQPYQLDLTATNLVLHPVAVLASKDEADDSSQSSAADETSLTLEIKEPNRLQAPDPNKPNTWVPMPATSWLFEPGELCPAQSVRLCRGKAWLELSFNALTGNVESEASYFP